jgi:hypothetical protein
MISDKTETMLVSMFLGILLFGIALEVTPSFHSKARKAIQECESTLSRNQHCEITATPKENP